MDVSAQSGFKTFLTKNQGSYIAPTAAETDTLDTGLLSLDTINKKPTSLIGRIKAVWSTPSQETKKANQAGIDEAREKIKTLYGGDQSVVERFNNEFVNSKKGCFWTTPSRYDKGAALSTDALLRFVDKLEKAKEAPKGTGNYEQAVSFFMVDNKVAIERFVAAYGGNTQNADVSAQSAFIPRGITKINSVNIRDAIIKIVKDAYRDNIKSIDTPFIEGKLLEQIAPKSWFAF